MADDSSQRPDGESHPVPPLPGQAIARSWNWRRGLPRSRAPAPSPRAARSWADRPAPRARNAGEMFDRSPRRRISHALSCRSMVSGVISSPLRPRLARHCHPQSQNDPFERRRSPALTGNLACLTPNSSVYRPHARVHLLQHHRSRAASGALLRNDPHGSCPPLRLAPPARAMLSRTPFPSP